MTDVSLVDERPSRSRRSPAAAARQRRPAPRVATQRTQREVSIPDLGAGAARARLGQALATLSQPAQVGQEFARRETIRTIDTRINEAQREAFNQVTRDPRKAREAALSGQIPTPSQFSDLPAFAHTWRVTSATLGAQEDAREFRERLATETPADPEGFLDEFLQDKLKGSTSEIFNGTYQETIRDATATDITNFRKTRQAVTAQQSLRQAQSWLRAEDAAGNVNADIETLHEIEGRYIASAVGPEGKSAAREQAYLDLVTIAAENPEKGYLMQLLHEPDPDKDGLSAADILGPELIAQKEREAVTRLFATKNVQQANAIMDVRQEFAEVQAGRSQTRPEQLLKQLEDVDRRWGESTTAQAEREKILNHIKTSLDIDQAVSLIRNLGTAEFLDDKVWRANADKIIEAIEAENPGMAAKVMAERGPGNLKAIMERDLASADRNRIELSMRRMRGMEEANTGSVGRWFNDEIATRFDIYDLMDPLGVPFEQIQEALRKSGSEQGLETFLRDSGLSVRDRDRIEQKVLKAADIDPDQLTDFAPARLERMTNLYLGIAEANNVPRDAAVERLGERIRQSFMPTMQNGRETYTFVDFNPIGLDAQSSPARVRPRTHEELKEARSAVNSANETEAMRGTFGDISGFSMLAGNQQLGYLAHSELDGFEQPMLFAPGQRIEVPLREFGTDPTEQLSLLGLPGLTMEQTDDSVIVTLPGVDDLGEDGLAIEGTELRLRRVGRQMGVFLGSPPEAPEVGPSDEDVLEGFEVFAREAQERAAGVEALTGTEGELNRMREDNRRFIEGLNLGFGSEFFPGEVSQAPNKETPLETRETPGTTDRLRRWTDAQLDDRVTSRKVPPSVTRGVRSSGVGSITEAELQLRDVSRRARAEGSDNDDPAAPNAGFDSFVQDLISNEEGVRLIAYNDRKGNGKVGKSIGRGILLVDPETQRVTETARRWLKEADLEPPEHWIRGNRLTKVQEQRLFDVAYADRKVETRARFMRMAQRGGFSEEDAKERFGGLTEHQRAVLISLVWNGGPGLIGPLITAAIMNRDDAAVAREIRTNSGSQRNPRLQRRRDREAAAWNSYKMRSR